MTPFEQWLRWRRVRGESRRWGYYRERKIWAPPDERRMRAQLPYGMWTCPDGRQVLFNRYYDPILQRYPGLLAITADPSEWVSWEHQEWFFKDATCPWGDDPIAAQRSGNLCVALLAEWGCA